MAAASSLCAQACMRLSSPRGRIGYPAGAVTGSRWVAVGGSNPFPQGEAAWASAKTRAGVGTRNRKPECQGPALIPAGAALHLATRGPRDIKASGLSGPTPPPFPEEVGVVRVPKVKEGVSVASSPLLPFCILRGPQSPASFSPSKLPLQTRGEPQTSCPQTEPKSAGRGGGAHSPLCSEVGLPLSVVSAVYPRQLSQRGIQSRAHLWQ